MILYNDSAIPERKEKILTIIVDTSGGMNGAKISYINVVIRKLLTLIEQRNLNNPGTIVKIAIMQYSNKAAWVNDKPIEPEMLAFDDLQSEGIANFSEACQELNNVLANNTQFINLEKRDIELFSVWFLNNEPQDIFIKSLNELQLNNLYLKSRKFLFKLADDIDENFLNHFALGFESVMNLWQEGTFLYSPENIVNKIGKFLEHID